jgi:hypothetical protein
MNLDLGYRSNWKSASVPLYKPGNYLLALVVSDTLHQSSGDTLSLQELSYSGKFLVDVEDKAGATALHRPVSGALKGRVSPQRTIWITIDTLRIPEGGKEWNIQVHIIDADPRLSGTPAQVVLIPPHASDFSDYLEEESPKLFLMGVLVIFGFSMIVAGGHLRKRSS